MNTPHNSSSPARWLLPATLAAVGAFGWACSQDDNMQGDAQSEANVARRAVLRSIADNVLVPSTQAFSAQAVDLQAAVATYASAVQADPGNADDSLQAAQLAWRGAMAQWQQLESMQIGPAASSAVGPGGEGLRDSIYSWPTADSCSVDRAIVGEDYLADDFFVTELPWVYGLDALEYLLFASDPDHTCATQVQLDGPWAALGSDELQRRRSQYATTISTAIADNAQLLALRWSADGDDYGSLLAQPRLSDSPYRDESEALDEVFRAMFYIDQVAKDDKLGAPLGLVEGCPTSPCVSLLESPWSGEGVAGLLGNLRGLKALIQGGQDPETSQGFDDLLVQAGEAALASTVLTEIETAIGVAQTIENSLQEVITTDPGQVTQLHTAVRQLSDTLKGPFVIALRLEIPAEGAGDAD